MIRLSFLVSLSHLEPKEAEEVKALLSEFHDIMSTGPLDLGSTTVIQHNIETTSEQPIRQAPRRLPMHQVKELRDHIHKLLEEGLISPSNSPWDAPIVVVRKPDGSIRLCVDYRQLNSKTVKDANPIPQIEEAIENMSNAKYFTTLDLAAGYGRVVLTNAARAKSAFVTRIGLYEWNVLPVGLCNALSTFQRLMNVVLADLIPTAWTAYVDDTITFAHSCASHLGWLRQVFVKFREAGLKVKPQKCPILRKSVKYLGHIFNEMGVSPDQKKNGVIVKWPSPNSIKDFRRFLGLASYYRRFVQNFASIASPLHKLTQKGIKFAWSAECQEAFDTFKHCLSSSHVLKYPDQERQLILDTDASDVGIGATLSQQDDDGLEHQVAFASKSLSKSQRHYSTSRREMYAVVFFTRYFRHYLVGANFTLRTDHKALL